MFDFDKTPDRISEKCRKWDEKIIKENFGDIYKPYIPMWIADMDFAIPTETKESLQEAIEIGVLGYTYVYDDFYNAVIDYRKYKNKISVEKEWITLSYGTVSTLHYVIQAFCNKGDSIIMNTPVYSPFESCSKKQGVNCVYNTLVIKNNRYYIDFDMLETQLKEYKPKVYLFCSPHNPSGRIWSKEEIRKIKNLCALYNVLLVVDEVHSEHINFGKFHSILTMTTVKDKIILLTSPNKAFNLGGLKTSYSIIPNKNIRGIFRSKLKQNSITSPNVFGIRALISSYNEGRLWFEEMVAYVQNNYAYLKNFIDNKLQLLSLMKMEASYLAWINIEKTGFSSTEFVHLLSKNYGVLLEDGKHFVQDGEGFVRMNLGTQYEHVVEACNRMKKFLA